MTTPATPPETGRQLDRAIAEALGWRNLEPFSYWAEDYDVGPYGVHTLRGFDADGHERLLPNWQDDLNAAIRLIKELPNDWNFELTWNAHAGTWTAIIIKYVSEKKYIYTEYAAAEAIALAWLAYAATRAPATPPGGVIDNE